MTMSGQVVKIFFILKPKVLEIRINLQVKPNP